MRIGTQEFDTKNQTYIMGILNVTPDSFSDGGRYNQLDAALFHAEAMLREGAAILDVGGESTRPGYAPVPAEEEIRRVVPVIRALTRRQPELRKTDTLEYGDLRLEKTSFTLFCGDRSVRLSRKEYDMMEILMLNREMVITKENLLLKVWGYESDAEENNVEVYISFLRKKLDHLRSTVKIRTIRMVGYCLEGAPQK